MDSDLQLEKSKRQANPACPKQQRTIGFKRHVLEHELGKQLFYCILKAKIKK